MRALVLPDAPGCSRHSHSRRFRCIPMHSDAFRCIPMHSDAFRCIPMPHPSPSIALWQTPSLLGRDPAPGDMELHRTNGQSLGLSSSLLHAWQHLRLSQNSLAWQHEGTGIALHIYIYICIHLCVCVYMYAFFDIRCTSYNFVVTDPC